MLTWIQNHLIKHGRWIFLTLLAVVIIAFVFTIGNVPGLAPRGGGAYEGIDYYGYDLRSESEMGPIGRMATLSSIIRTGQPPQTAQQAQQAVLGRIALLHLADQIGIPAPGEAQLAAYIRTIPRFLDQQSGDFNRERYLGFIDAVNASQQYSEQMVARVLEDDYRIDKLRAAIAGPGYTLPVEARQQAERTTTVYSLLTAALDYDSFEPAIEPAAAEVEAYFEEHKTDYEIPERIEAGYVLFNAAAYSGGLPAPAAADLREHFIADRDRFVTAYLADNPPAEGEDAPEVSFEDVRDRVAEDLLERQARRAANEAAADFAYQLYDRGIALDSADYRTLLTDSGVTEESLEPYPVTDLYGGGMPPELLRAGLDLNADQYFSDAVAVPGGFAVLIYRGRIEPEIPPFETVADDVRADYIETEKQRLFEEHAEELKAEIAAAIEDGSSFEDAAAERELEVASYEDFTVADMDPTLPGAVLEAAERLAPGDVSGPVEAPGGGRLVYVAAKEIPEIDDADPDYQQAESFIRNYSATVSEQAGLSELVRMGNPEEF